MGTMSDETATREAQIQSIVDLLNQPVEPIHPHLAEYTVDTEIGVMIKHPLVYAYLFHEREHARINATYEAKRRALGEAIAGRKWNNAVFLYERPYRLNAFNILQDQLEDQEYWQLLGNVWTDSENIWQNRDTWREALTANRPDRHMLMDKEEQAALALLPDALTVYRGFMYDDGEEGMSWTLDQQKAKWFARRFHIDPDCERPRIATGHVSKEKVIAYFTGRNEDEIVALPEDVENRRFQDV